MLSKKFLLDLETHHILEKNFTSNPKILEKNILIKTKHFKKKENNTSRYNLENKFPNIILILESPL